jgi:hypothetical protein
MNKLRGFNLRQLLLVLALLLSTTGVGLVSHASVQKNQSAGTSNCSSSCLSHTGVNFLKAESTLKEEDDDKEPTPPLSIGHSSLGYRYIAFVASLGAFVWFSKRHKILLTTHYKS